MIRLTRTHPQPIGVDIGTDSVKLLQTELVGGGGASTVSVVAAARQDLPADAADASPLDRVAMAAPVVRQMVRRGGFHGRDCVAALPSELVHVKNLRLPPMPHDELSAAIQYEAKAIFPFDTSAALVQHVVAGEVRQGGEARQEVIVFAVQRADIDNYLEQLHRCGLGVESLDLEYAALYRTIERYVRRREDENDVHVMLDVGGARSKVVIGRGREISFVKSIELGGRAMNQAVARRLSISLDEAKQLRQRIAADVSAADDSVRSAVLDTTRGVIEELVREFSLCLRYYSVTFRGQRPLKVRVCGGEGADPQVQHLMNAGLSIPAEPGRPLASADVSRVKSINRRSPLSEWAVAFGLSMKLTKGAFAPSPGAMGSGERRGGPVAEVVDLNAAVHGTQAPSGTRAAANATPAAANPKGTPAAEAVHA
jgi:type IV pilus assembly protein PilM